MKRIINLIVILAIAALVVAQDKKASSKGKTPEVDSTQIKLEQLKKSYQEQNTKMDSILLEKAK